MSTRDPIRLNRRDLSALTDFARAYLHQDLVVEYGTAMAAGAAFALDASVDERRRVADALDVLAAIGNNRPLDSLQRFLVEKVRCAWVPTSPSDLADLARAIRIGGPRNSPPA